MKRNFNALRLSVSKSRLGWVFLIYGENDLQIQSLLHQQGMDDVHGEFNHYKVNIVKWFFCRVCIYVSPLRFETSRDENPVKDKHLQLCTQTPQSATDKLNVKCHAGFILQRLKISTSFMAVR